MSPGKGDCGNPQCWKILRDGEICRENSEELPAWKGNRMESHCTDGARDVSRDNNDTP